MCIPADSMLWALVARIRDEAYIPSLRDVEALIGSGCPRARVKEVLGREAAGRPAFQEMLAMLER